MRIVSLQPSITVTLAALDALDEVVGCTRYCREVCPETEDEERVVLEDSWSAESSQIRALNPDIVVASVPYRMESLAEILKSGVRVVALAPKTLADVAGDIRLLAALVDQRASGEHLIAEFQREIEATKQQCAGEPRQKVYCEEWGKPLICSQRWVAELVEAAGGLVIGDPGAHVSAEQIAEAQPEVVLAAWCGAGIRVPLRKLAAREGWSATPAVSHGRVYCVSDELFNTPAHTLVGGLKAIRWALHPQLFARPEGIRSLKEEAEG